MQSIKRSTTFDLGLTDAWPCSGHAKYRIAFNVDSPMYDVYYCFLVLHMMKPSHREMNLQPEHSEADICIFNFIHYMPL